MDKPRWLDVILAALVFGLLIAVIFLFVENVELRLDDRDRKHQMETLIRWHIHVSAQLEMDPVIDGTEESDNAERRTKE